MREAVAVDSQSLVASSGGSSSERTITSRPASDLSLGVWFVTALDLYATAFNVFTGTIAPKNTSRTRSASSSAVRALRYRSSSKGHIRRLAERLKMIWRTESKILSSLEGFYSPLTRHEVETGCRRHLCSKPLSVAPSIDESQPPHHPATATITKHEQVQKITEVSNSIPFQHLQSAVPPRRTCKLIDPYRARLRRRHKLRPSHSRPEESSQLDTINEEQSSSDDCGESDYDEEDDNDHMTVIVHDITDENSYCDMKCASSYLYAPKDSDDDDDEEDDNYPEAHSESFSLTWALHYQRVKMKTKMTKVKKRAMALVTKRM